jgi:hypothetical protein
MRSDTDATEVAAIATHRDASISAEADRDAISLIRNERQIGTRRRRPRSSRNPHLR